MNKLFVIALLAGGLYLSYQQNLFDELLNLGRSGPIENPVYGRMTVDIRADGREVEGIFLARLRSENECQERMDTEVRDLLKQCPACRLGSASCSTTIAEREVRYFEQTPTHLTYLHGAPAGADEREFAMIYWGLTVAEARMICDLMENIVSDMYRGDLTCVQEHDI